MKIFFTTILILFIVSSCVDKKAEKYKTVNIGVIPQPLSIQQNNLYFELTDSVGIVINSTKKETLFTTVYLQTRIKLLTGLDLDTSLRQKKSKRKIILIEKKPDKTSNNESYEIEISLDKITVIGEGAGLFYGVQTLLQIIQNYKTQNHSVIIPAFTIKDTPRFLWRGMHLDESRHFFGVNEVKKYLDIMAIYKLNTFHWHLTDDQGWRIEIKSHPKLTDIGAWREGTVGEEWSYFIKPATQNKPRYGGFYTQEQIKEVVEYAQERFITIVPEIELPGHSWAALSAYPELSCSGKIWNKPDSVAFEFSDPFCVGNEETFELFDDVLAEVIDLFPSEYIHIGGDECKKTPWESCSKCQARMKKENIDNVEELQSYFIKRVEKIVSLKGRKIIGWEEIMEGGLPKEAVVMSWKGVESGIKAANLGYKSIMTPGNYMYFNKSQNNNSPNQIGVLTLPSVYNYNPAPDTLNHSISDNIIGVQGSLWSEYINSDSILEIQLLPRLTALAEVAWSCNDVKNWNSYLLRLENQFPIFEMLDMEYFIQPPLGLGNNIFVGDKSKVELTIPYKKGQIFYTTDNTEPSLGSKEYKKPFFVEENTIIKAKTFFHSHKFSKVSVGTYKKDSFLTALVFDNLQPGLLLKIYMGNISTVDKFSELKFSKEYVFSRISVPKNEGLTEFYGLEFLGYIDVDTDDIYTFYLSSDDGSKLFIDNRLIVDNDGVHGYRTELGKVALRKGNHSIEVKYFQGNYGAELDVEVYNSKDDLLKLNLYH